MPDFTNLSPGVPVIGCLERLVGSRGVVGWALNSAQPTRSAQIEILIDGRPIGVCVADRSRPDLGSALRGHDRCGFFFEVSEAPAAAKPAKLTARCASTGTVLWGSVNLAQDTARLDGEVSFVGGGRLEGWAVDLDELDRPLVLSVFVGPTIVAVGQTGLERSAAKSSVEISARSRFAIDIAAAYPERADGVFSVFIANTRFELRGSPVFQQLTRVSPARSAFSFILD